MRATFTRGRPASTSASRCTGRRRRAPRPSRSRPTRVAARIEDTVEAWRSWEAEHDIYDGPARRARPAQLARAEGPDVPADGRDRRRADDLAAGDRRRRAQLGLPLRVDPRREPDARGALHRRLLGRGRGLRLVHDQLRRRPRRRAARCRSCTASAASTTSPSASSAPARLARLGARARRQRRLGADAARRLRRAAQLAAICYREQLGELHPEIQRFVADLADTAARRWRETDAGMWEMRGEPRHHLSSKVLCWVALDRAIKLAPPLGDARASRALDGRARRDPRGDARARLERGAAGVRAVVRLRRARRGAAADADRRLPAGDRRAHALDDRGDRRAT